MSTSETGSGAPSRPPQVGPATRDASKAMTLFVMVVATLYFGKEVLVPVTLALLLAFLLAPLVGLLRRAHLGKIPSVLLGVIVALGVTLIIGGVIGSQIAQLSTNLPHYVTTIETKVGKVRAYTVGRLSELADRVGSKPSQPIPTNGASRISAKDSRSLTSRCLPCCNGRTCVTA